MSIEAVTSNEVNVGSLLYITGLSSKCGFITIPVDKLPVANIVKEDIVIARLVG